MRDVNKIMLVGNVGFDVDSHGEKVASFKLCTKESWIDKAGETKSRSEYHRVVCFRKLGEMVKGRVKKGSRLLVQGSIRTNTWKNKDGVDQKTTEVIADHVEVIDSGGVAREAVVSAVEEGPSYGDVG